MSVGAGCILLWSLPVTAPFFFLVHRDVNSLTTQSCSHEMSGLAMLSPPGWTQTSETTDLPLLGCLYHVFDINMIKLPCQERDVSLEQKARLRARGGGGFF